ncbi:MAG: deaminase [Candidatus Gracilibacteria bacterium]|nr:deaminase [Candidatus Gracilibacteria bacterium]MDD2909124.1 deaminase [Candidatus Gracilibacteria bacterium]
MKLLSEQNEIDEALEYLEEARIVGLQATCTRSKCGSVIVKNGEIIGVGYNSPASELENQRRCSCNKDDYHKKVTDKTCCIHAEQRAIMDALRKNPDKIIGSRLYFSRLDDIGNIKYSGEPYCTICSKMSLDVGIREFVLYKKEGICVYETGEYNDLSYKYSE